MKVNELEIPEVKVIEPDVFNDDRGFFYESFNQEKFNNLICRDTLFVQDNHSSSKKSVLRGLHFQDDPFSQGKLVRVIQGEIYDVAVDIRKMSSTYGKWVSEILSSDNKKQLWIPPGFAHGFLTLSNTADLLYKVTSPYNPKYEKTIVYNDPSLQIDWNKFNFRKLILSPKDLKGQKFDEI